MSGKYSFAIVKVKGLLRGMVNSYKSILPDITLSQQITHDKNSLTRIKTILRQPQRLIYFEYVNSYTTMYVTHGHIDTRTQSHAKSSAAKIACRLKDK